MIVRIVFSDFDKVLGIDGLAVITLSRCVGAVVKTRPGSEGRIVPREYSVT